MTAIGYLTIGTIDSQKSGIFYDAVFAALGSERKFEKVETAPARASWTAIRPSTRRLMASKRSEERRVGKECRL